MKQQFGLIGYPLGHSFSMNYFTERFARERCEATYANYEIPTITELPRVIQSQSMLKGLNVTIPYKEQVIPYLDTLDPATAGRLHAVNVIKIIRDGDRYQLEGYNTDIIGFTESIRPLLQPTHHKALILGTGGASKAIFQGLKDLHITPIRVSRKKKEGCLTYEELTPEIMASHTVIVNCTPLGTYPNVSHCAAIPYHHLTPNHLLYDLVYNPEETLFLRKGREQGAQTKNGLEMLRLQAEASWTIWQK